MASKFVIRAEVEKLKIAMEATVVEAVEVEAAEGVEAVEDVDERVADWKQFMSARAIICYQWLQLAL